MLVDLASTHGTYVNGERIDRRILNFGDTIQIVSHELTLSRELPEDITTTNGSMTTPKMARTLDRRLKFFGGLNEFSLITLVQFLHQEKQSGLLLLELGQKPGPRIYFQDGEIIHVVAGREPGRAARAQEPRAKPLLLFPPRNQFPHAHHSRSRRPIT